MDQRTQTTLRYFQSQQQSRQWKPLLTALGSLLSKQMPTRDLRAFMRALGKRMATELPLPACDTLDELQDAMNACWSEMDWGWVALAERERAISIEHAAAPLVAGFGGDATRWAPALLEGLYASWFADFGAGDPLVLSQVNEQDESDAHLEFLLGHPSIFE